MTDIYKSFKNLPLKIILLKYKILKYIQMNNCIHNKKIINKY